MRRYRNIVFVLCFSALALVNHASFAASSPTYTYLRCFYQVADQNDLSPGDLPTNLNPATEYVWARDPSDPTNKRFYQVQGYWQSADSFYNMFYTNTSQDELVSVCQSTFKNNLPAIKGPVAMHAAANYVASINYMVWTNDPEVQDGKINKIVAFGDSLSDTQNLFNASLWTMLKPGSYFAGRFSNGKIWLDYTSEDLHLPVYNWAVGGATAEDYYIKGLAGVKIPGINSQVDSWLNYKRDAINYRPENTLFTILIGENDLVNINESGLDGSKKIQDTVDTEEDALIRLISKGSAKNILLINLPDVSRAPLFALGCAETDTRLSKQLCKEKANYVHAQIKNFNDKLAQLATRLKTQYAVNIQVFDSYNLVNLLMADPGYFGFTNTTQSCLNINSNGLDNYLYTWYPRPNCTDADTFVFWDLLHPTTHAHQLMSQMITGFIQSEYNL